MTTSTKEAKSTHTFCGACGRKFRVRHGAHKFCSDRCKERAHGAKLQKKNGLGLLVSEDISARFHQALRAAELSTHEVSLKLNVPKSLIDDLTRGPCAIAGHGAELLCDVAAALDCSSAWLIKGGQSPRAERLLGQLRAAIRGDNDSARELFRALETLP